MSNIRQGLIAKKCSCKGYSLEKFIQPNLLYLLAQGDKHGYILIQDLQDLPMFSCDSLDKTGIYRSLKKLENQALITARWDMEGSGSARKIYHLTEKGHLCMNNWIDTLKIHAENIFDLAHRIEEVRKHHDECND